MNEHNTYLLLDLAVLSIPLMLSFDRRVRFFRLWNAVLPAILLVAIPFIAWDIWFTSAGYWGFNERYLTGVAIAGLPLSEVLFFFVVPYACVFLYETMNVHFGKMILKERWEWLLVLVAAGAALLLLYSGSRPYTLVVALSGLLICMYLLMARPGYVRVFAVSYCLCLLPFLGVNGLLTGSWIPEEVVWYSEDAFSGLRIGTIPAEDLLYTFDLLALNVIAFEWLRKRRIVGRSKAPESL